MSLDIQFSDRLQELPPYLFVEIDKAKRAAKAAGRDIIDLGVGDPDLPTPAHIIAALKKASDNPENHHYAFDAGVTELRAAIAQWFQRRFAVSLDISSEI
ncbi:MAG: aminotransferase class I/II-fold pyridoxal phosphate-dependent enzyme, partial [Candidatus Omnitrophota bacterium]